MYGIPDFEDRIAAVPDSELAPHLSSELGRVPWPQEREELMPQPTSKRKFVYKGDFLSDRLVEQQERAQAFQNNLLVHIDIDIDIIIIYLYYIIIRKISKEPPNFIQTKLMKLKVFIYRI